VYINAGTWKGERGYPGLKGERGPPGMKGQKGGFYTHIISDPCNRLDTFDCH